MHSFIYPHLNSVRCGNDGHAHYADEETETQRSEVTAPTSCWLPGGRMLAKGSVPSECSTVPSTQLAPWGLFLNE